MSVVNHKEYLEMLLYEKKTEQRFLEEQHKINYAVYEATHKELTKTIRSIEKQLESHSKESKPQ